MNDDERANAPIDDWLPKVYDDLRRMAAARMRHERKGHTLQATAVVHEAWAKLNSSGGVEDQVSKAQALAYFARTMNQVLIDYAKARARQKRAGTRVDLATDPVAQPDIIDMLEWNEALEHLDEELVQIVIERSIGGMTYEDMAIAHGCSEANIRVKLKRACEQLRPYLSAVPDALTNDSTR